jgi:uncharacterized protein (TIRG00374 family)
MMFWKKKQFWGALIGIILLAFCLKDIRLQDIELLLRRINPYYIIPSAIACYVFIVLRGLRWRILISQQSAISVPRSVSLYSAGQVLNIIMPVLTGQVGRLILFARKQSLRKTFVFSTILLEVVFDAVSLIIFMFFTSLAFVFPSEYRFVSFIVAGVTLFVLALLYLMLNFQTHLENLLRRTFRERSPGAYITFKKFIRSFTQGIKLLRSSQHMFVIIGYSLLSWLGHVLAIYFLFMSFGFKLPVASAAAVMIINTIILMVPITPGNAGTFEVAVSTSLAAFSIGRTDAVLFALALHLLDLLPIVTLGMAFFWHEKVSLREFKEQHEDQDIFDKISEEGTFIEEEHV